MSGTGESWRTLRDLGAVLALMIPLGTLFYQALFSGQSLWFIISFALTVVSIVAAARCFWWSFGKKDAWKTSKSKSIAVLATSLFLVVGFGTVARITANQPEVEASRALELRSYLVDSFSGFRIGIIGKVKRWGKDNYIPPDSELRYQLVSIDPDGKKIVYKQFQPSGRKLMLIDGIAPGLYEVRLVFYGLTLDNSGTFKVGGKLSHIVSLTTSGHDLKVYFNIKNKNGHPLEGVWVEVVGPQGQHIRGEPDHSKTDKNGITKNPLWIPPLPVLEKRNYVAVIQRGNKEIISRKEFRIEGTTEYWNRTEVKLIINNQNTQGEGNP